MTKYKAIIYDVDGTLIPNRHDGVPSKKLIEAVRKAQKTTHIGVATARSYALLSPVSSLLHLTGPSIVHGGPRIVDMATQTTLWEQPMEPTEMKQIVDFADSLKIQFKIYDNSEEIKYSPTYKPFKPYNIWAHKTTDDIVEKFRHFTSQFSDITVHTVPSWEMGKIDFTVTHVNATKQHGIFEIAKILKIDTHEIIGVGDGNNDLPLLMACGLKVAMGNAGEDLKAIADYIAPDVENDGAVDVIEKFVLN